MGCGGGYHSLFRLIDGYDHSRGGCGSNREPHQNHYSRDDSEEKLILIKKMYAEDVIDDEEYQSYKNRIYERSISFDELIAIKRKRSNKEYQSTKSITTKSTRPYSKYKEKLGKLNASKDKITQVQDKLISSIKDLQKEKERMESLAETMLGSSDEAAEKYINKKIDLEENIQNLVRRNKELKIQAEEIDRTIKELEAKELELEAVKLQEELSNIVDEE